MADRHPSPMRPPFTAFRPDSAVNPHDVHPVIHAGRVAVVTGAAHGIGRAAALELAHIGLRIALADNNEELLRATGKEVAGIVGEQNVLVVPTDVSKIEEVHRLRDKVFEQWGEVAVLLNNAGIGPRSSSWEDLDNWRKIFEVNLFGIVNVQHAFVPNMIHQENPAVIINTGSKQGITNPPGNAAYNASKAAIKSLTEGLSHELRNTPNTRLTAHLFVPGWTFAKYDGSEKPAGAWTPQETVLYMLDKVRSGEFYVIVPDNETRREVDALRILWSAGDIVEGRPALSRWHPDYKGLFEDYLKEGLASMS